MMSQAPLIANRAVNKKEDAESAFTLIELMIGIAVSSLLLVGLFQLLTDLTVLRREYLQTSTEMHRRAALSRLLDQDLTSLPVSESNFIGRQREFYRTTIAYSPTRNLRMETRVHYYLRRRNGKTQLVREARWLDLQDNYGESRIVYSAPTIDLRYRTTNNRTVNFLGQNQTAAFVSLVLPDNVITFPLGRRPDDAEEEANEQTPTPS